MTGPFSRTELLFGNEAIQKLAGARVAIFGVGGVGGYALEALVRSGIGAVDIIDSDRVCLSNLNRQIIATRDTLDEYKVDAAAERARSINPDIVVTTYKTFFLPENSDQFDFRQYDYVIDAVDTVTAKTEIIMKADREGVPVISCMGTGNKTDPTKLKVADVYKTTVCPLARVMRKELKKRGIKKLKVVYSTEEPLVPAFAVQADPGRRSVPGSCSFVPSAAGLIIAGEVIKSIIGKED